MGNPREHHAHLIQRPSIVVRLGKCPEASGLWKPEYARLCQGDEFNSQIVVLVHMEMLTYILRVGEFYHTWEFDLNGDGFKYSSCCWGYSSVGKVLAFPARSPMLHPQHPIDWAYTAFGIEAGGSEILSDLWLQSSFEVSLRYRTSCHSAPQRAPDVRTLMEIHIRGRNRSSPQGWLTS